MGLATQAKPLKVFPMKLMKFYFLLLIGGSTSLSTLADPKDQVSRAKSLIADVGRALDAYYADCGEYPKRLEDLYLPTQSCVKNWGPDPYLKNGLKDPWGKKLKYRLINKDHYELRSLGPDPSEGGSGENLDLLADP